MKKRSRRRQTISWLPIDSRLVPNIISFGHVRGVARVFLQIEIILSFLVVMGVFIILFLKFLEQ